jgi:hypothetical protein
MNRLSAHRGILFAGCVGVAGLAAITAMFTTVQPADGAADDAEYVGYQQCQICHGHQNQVWSGMGHARAYERLETDEAKAVAAELGLDVPPAEHPDCLRCHVTGYDAEERRLPAAIRLEHGVQCESCHGPSSEHIVIGRQVMFGQAQLEDVDIMAGRPFPGESNCLQCHNTDSPTWRDDRYTLEDGTTTGFDFEQAMELIDHSEPEDD